MGLFLSQHSHFFDFFYYIMFNYSLTTPPDVRGHWSSSCLAAPDDWGPTPDSLPGTLWPIKRGIHASILVFSNFVEHLFAPTVEWGWSNARPEQYDPFQESK